MILETPYQCQIKEGDYPQFDQRNMFFIGDGTCKVTVKDARGHDKIVKNLTRGDHFGEINLIYNCKRTATVHSTNYTTFIYIMIGEYK